MKQADRIRQYALTQYVERARIAGDRTVSIRAGDICRGLGLAGRAANVCSALQSNAFLRLAGVQLLGRTGPRQSTTTRFRYAIALCSADEVQSVSPSAMAASPSPRERPFRRSSAHRASAQREMTVVIQCAASKTARAGHFVDEDGKPILFVARPQAAPPNPRVAYQHPDDPGRDGRTWREELVRYNRLCDDNHLELLPAWQLYENAVYGELIEAFGEDRVLILSAGWGAAIRRLPDAQLRHHVLQSGRSRTRGVA